MTDEKYFNAFNQIREIGSVRMNRLLSYFPSLDLAWRAQNKDLMAAGLEAAIVEIVQAKRRQIDPDVEMEKLDREGVRVMTINSPEYPNLLKEISNPPALLYVRGKMGEQRDAFSVAVVGTRKISTYGKQITPLIVKDLSASGITIVSGLALGVDELAHRTCVEAGGRTIAVLGSGIDERSIYPSFNRATAKKIIDSGGALISELPLYSLPLKMHFPYRNRIIAGLSLGTVIVEADLKSGSLITAKLALEQNRQIFAVPGSVFNRSSAGPNNLLKMGAKAVTCAADILEELNLEHTLVQTAAREILPETPLEAKLLPLLSAEPTHINKLIKESGLSTAEVSSALTMMEIKGKIRNLGAMQYVKGR